MGFPTRLLSKGEELILDLRPHWIAFVPWVALALLVAAADLVLLQFLPADWPSWIEYALLIVGLIVILRYPVPRVVRWSTSHFVVTSKRVIHRSGLLARQSMEIPLANINDVRFHQSLVERMIGAGDLTIESAGERGQETFSDVRRPEFVQKTIYEMSEEAARRSAEAAAPTMQFASPATAARPPTSPASSPAPQLVADEVAKLDDLRRRGIISEEEFARQKARLLGP